MLVFVFVCATVVADPCDQLCSSELVSIYARLNALAAHTRGDSERAAFLFRRNDGRLDVVLWPQGDMAEASYKGRIPANCIAIVHTHPVVAPRPSRRDVTEAQRIRLPIVVITPDAITVATVEGETRQLLGAGWTRLSR